MVFDLREFYHRPHKTYAPPMPEMILKLTEESNERRRVITRRRVILPKK